jgi:hypothetical protein
LIARSTGNGKGRSILSNQSDAFSNISIHIWMLIIICALPSQANSHQATLRSDRAADLLSERPYITPAQFRQFWQTELRQSLPESR